MVKSIPHVNVTHEQGLVARVLDTDQTLACVVECKKGTPNQPVLIRSPGMLRREFGVDLDAYWAAGGGPLYVTRAAYQTAAKATHFIKDATSAATPELTNVLKLEARRAGSSQIHISFSASGSGLSQRLSVTLEEEGGVTEYFLGVRRSLVPNDQGEYRSALENLVDKLNAQSDIVKAYYKTVDDEANIQGVTPADSTFVDEVPQGEFVFIGTATYPRIVRTIMGSGAGNIAGSDGSYLKPEKEQKMFDNISDELLPDDYENVDDQGRAPSEIAHEAALASLEQLEIAGVFCLKTNPYELTEDGLRTRTQVEETGDIFGPYLAHIEKMNTPEMHAWRFAIVGGNENMDMIARLANAGRFNNELMIFVGGGLVDINGVEYTPELATQAVAGKISATRYNLAIWGGQPSKALRSNKNFIMDIMPIAGQPIYDDPDAVSPVMVGETVATRSEMIEYNEAGVLTFLKDKDGVKITEGITTVQEFYNRYGIKREDEIAVMRIILHSKYQVYDACYKMLGQNLNSTFKQDLENAVRNRLSLMSDEGALYDFDAAATVGPVIDGEQGEIRVDISISPMHAARIIDAVIVVL